MKRDMNKIEMLKRIKIIKKDKKINKEANDNTYTYKKGDAKF